MQDDVVGSHSSIWHSFRRVYLCEASLWGVMYGTALALIIVSLLPVPSSQTRFRIDLPVPLAEQVHEMVRSGEYVDADDVFREALRVMARERTLSHEVP
jgi:hypothetical protein